ncbi:methionine adenosyltransferase [Dermabacteraceae bacterium P13088]
MTSSQAPLRLFTSESITEGHPDKVCDQISDAILDDLLRQDPSSRVAVETLATRGFVQIAGEVSTSGYCDIDALARGVLSRIGYNGQDAGFDATTCGINVSIGHQSPNIASGVDTSWEKRHGGGEDELSGLGAGDQGLMFGYACDETPSLMPLPIDAAHDLALALTAARRDEVLNYLLPDGKTQITVGYDESGTPRSIETVVLSTQHRGGIDLEGKLIPEVEEAIVRPFLARMAERGLLTGDAEIIINPAGEFVLGGPAADTGLTGRKIIADTYGGYARHGGGAFSGKDPSKVDRSAAYAARWIAKNVVAAGFARRCEIQLAYAIGRAQPVGIYVETYGTETVSPQSLERAIREVFDLRPAAIIAALDLRAPRYLASAAYGHFGREDAGFTWENRDRVADLRAALA